MTTTTTAPELRTYGTGLELREVQAVGAGKAYQYLEGRAVPYDTWGDTGWFMEQHQAGSFKRSTGGRSGAKLPLLLFHDSRSFPIGHADSWRHDDGLVGVWKLNGTEPAQQAARMAEDGDLVGMSVGFQDVASPLWDWPAELNLDGGPDQKPHVTRVESRLIEVSLTPTPVYADAGVTMVRTQSTRPTPPEPDVDRWRRTVEGLRST